MRIVSAAEAVAGIPSGQQLYLQCAAATPSVLLDALVARAPELLEVGVVHLHCEGPGPHLAPEMAPHFRHRALFIGPNARAAIAEGRAEYIPTFLSDVPRLFDSGLLPLDAVFVNATPPDAHGFCSLGTSVEAMHAAIRAAKTVIVQFNAGDAADARRQLHPRLADRPRGRMRRPALRASGRPARRGRAADRRVRGRPRPRRRHAPARDRGASRRRPRWPSATSGTSGVHTEMFTDSVVDLVEAGVITGARKERNRGKLVAAFMMGTKRLYDFVDDNPMVEMRPVDFTNDTHVIRSFSRMVAINSAIEVDLTGPGRRRLDRPSAVQRRRWPDGLHPRRRAGVRGPGDHRAAVDRRGGQVVADRGVTPRGRRSRDDAGARADRGDRVGRRRAVRAEPARTRGRRSSGSPTPTRATASWPTPRRSTSSEDPGPRRRVAVDAGRPLRRPPWRDRRARGVPDRRTERPGVRAERPVRIGAASDAPLRRTEVDGHAHASDAR